MANVGYATLTVSPSMRGMQQSMQRQLGGMMPQAGRRAGQQLGQAIGAGATANVAGDLRRASAAAAAEVARASGALAKARQAEIQSANRVRTAEQRLTDTWNNSKATAAQLRTARQGLTTAQAQHGVATNQVAQAQRQLTAAEAGAASAQRQLATATAQTTQAVQAQGAQVAGSATRWQTLRAGAGSALSSIRSGVAGIGGAISTQITSRTQQATGAMGGLGASIRGMAGMAAIFTAGMGFAQMGREIQNVAGGAQRTERVLDGMYQAAGHGAAEAQKMTRLLNQEFSSSTIAMTAFQRGAENLAYLGLTARDTTDLMSFLESVIVSTGGSADNLDSVTSALQTIQNQGRATMNEINQISGNGVPILDMLADKFGVDIPEAMEMVSDGAVDINDVLGALEDQGGTWAGALVDSADNVADSFDAASASLRNTIINGLAQQVLPLLDRLAPRMVAIRNRVEGAFDGLPAALSRVRSAMDQYGVTDALRSIYDAAANLARGAGPLLSGLATGIGVAFGAALVALGPVADLLSELGEWMQNNTATVRAFGIAVGVVAGAFLVLKGALAIGGAIAALATPIGWVTLAIGLLVAGITYAWRESATFRAVVVGAWEAVQRAVSFGVDVITGVIAHLRDETTLLGGIWSTIWNGVSNHFAIVWAAIQSIWEAGQQILSGGIELITGLLTGDWERAWSGAKDMALGAWELLKAGMLLIGGQIWNALKTFFIDLPSNVRGWLVENLPAILEGLAEWWEAFKGWIVETTPKIVDQIVEWGTAIGNWLANEAPAKIIDGAQQLWDNHLKPWFEDLPNKITKAFDSVQKFQQWLAEYGPTLLKGLTIAVGVVVIGIPALILAIGAAILTGLAVIGQTIASAFTTHLRSAATRAFTGMQQTATQRVSTFITWLRGLPGRARAALAQMATQMRTVGRNIISGIISGVSGSASRLFSNLRGVARRALSAAKSALGISSPSRVFRDEVGGEIVAGLLGGIDAGQRQVDQALAGLVSTTPTAGISVPVSTEVARHAARQHAEARLRSEQQVTLDVTGTDRMMKQLVLHMVRTDPSFRRSLTGG